MFSFFPLLPRLCILAYRMHLCVEHGWYRSDILLCNLLRMRSRRLTSLFQFQYLYLRLLNLLLLLVVQHLVMNPLHLLFLCPYLVFVVVAVVVVVLAVWMLAPWFLFPCVQSTSIKHPAIHVFSFLSFCFLFVCLFFKSLIHAIIKMEKWSASLQKLMIGFGSERGNGIAPQLSLKIHHGGWIQLIILCRVLVKPLTCCDRDCLGFLFHVRRFLRLEFVYFEVESQIPSTFFFPFFLFCLPSFRLIASWISR